MMRKITLLYICRGKLSIISFNLNYQKKYFRKLYADALDLKNEYDIQKKEIEIVI